MSAQVMPTRVVQGAGVESDQKLPGKFLLQLPQDRLLILPPSSLHAILLAITFFVILTISAISADRADAGRTLDIDRVWVPRPRPIDTLL